MRNQPGIEHEKAWPQLNTTLCLRKPLHIDNSSSNDDSVRYCQSSGTEVTQQNNVNVPTLFTRNNHVEHKVQKNYLYFNQL